LKKYRLLSGASDLKGKRVLLRAGFDLPMEDGKVSDVTRVEAILETMTFILKQGAVLVILAHQGRPKDGPDPAFSQKPVVPVLEKLLKTTVHFASDCIGPAAEKAVKSAKPGEVVLLENLRFHPEEKKNDPAFSKALASLGDVYVNDAFTNCHRNHASMVGVPKILPAYMGLNLEQEIKHLTPAVEKPEKPLTLIIAGSKMETKVPVIQRFLEKGDFVLVGGCIANTLIAARGFDTGASRYDEEGLELAQEMMLESEKGGRAKILVPRDVVVASELSETAEKIDIPVEDVVGDMAIYDIGKVTIERYIEAIRSSKMIVWNGPLGVYEYNRFSHATKRIAEAVAEATKRGAITLIGGGDTVDFHLKYGYPLDAYTFVSMGGGAMLEFVAGKQFESLKVLEK
jgi:phosphoglycerate kinase